MRSIFHSGMHSNRTPHHYKQVYTATGLHTITNRSQFSIQMSTIRMFRNKGNSAILYRTA